MQLGQKRGLDFISANIDDLLEGFIKNEKDSKLFFLNHQENRLQPLDLERQ